jgi:hypothetical protein
MSTGGLPSHTALLMTKTGTMLCPRRAQGSAALEEVGSSSSSPINQVKNLTNSQSNLLNQMDRRTAARYRN